MNEFEKTILYQLYKYAEQHDRYHFSVSEFKPNSVLDTFSKNDANAHLRGLDCEYHKYISVEIVADLDNINLRRNITSKEIDMIQTQKRY